MCNLFFCDTVSGHAIFDITESLYLYRLWIGSVSNTLLLLLTTSLLPFFFFFFLCWEMKSRGGQSQSGKVKNVSVAAQQDAGYVRAEP